MGKHDMKSNRFSWEPDKTEFYKERIETLEKQNESLREKNKRLSDALGAMELAAEHGETVFEGINNELKDEIVELKREIATLKKAIVNAAVREAQK